MDSSPDFLLREIAMLQLLHVAAVCRKRPKSNDLLDTVFQFKLNLFAIELKSKKRMEL
jgi:hypothetical protein